jgi:predicted CoA-binding protein
MVIKMELNEIMLLSNFVVLGNTILEDKYAYKIKKGLIDAGYNVRCVGKELESINDVDFEIDVLDLCIHPALGIKLLKENKKKIKIVVIQPGAESEEIYNFLNENNIQYIDACLLVGLRLYSK